MAKWRRFTAIDFAALFVSLSRQNTSLIILEEESAQEKSDNAPFVSWSTEAPPMFIA